MAPATVVNYTMAHIGAFCFFSGPANGGPDDNAYAKKAGSVPSVSVGAERQLIYFENTKTKGKAKASRVTSAPLTYPGNKKHQIFILRFD